MNTDVSDDGAGGRVSLPRMLAFKGLFLASLALVFCTLDPPSKGLLAPYHFALFLLLLSGIGLILLGVWVSDHGAGGRARLSRMLAFLGLFLASMALAFCTLEPPSKGLLAAHNFALFLLFLSGIRLVLLGVWVSDDGAGGRARLFRTLAFVGLFLASMALAFCTLDPPSKGLLAAYHFALFLLFLSGIGLILLGVWVSDHGARGRARLSGMLAFLGLFLASMALAFCTLEPPSKGLLAAHHFALFPLFLLASGSYCWAFWVSDHPTNRGGLA